MQPSQGSTAGASPLWTDIDQRTYNHIDTYVKRNVGIPRLRDMTATIPLGSVTSPSTGILTQLAIFSYVRINGYLINALVPGTISIDLQASVVDPDPTVAPQPVSIINAPGADPAVYIECNGYGIVGYDTSGWFARDIQGPAILYVIVNAVAGLAQAVLGLQLVDLKGRTLQI